MISLLFGLLTRLVLASTVIDQHVWYSPIVLTGTCVEVNVAGTCTEINAWYVYKGRDLLASPIMNTKMVDGFETNVIQSVNAEQLGSYNKHETRLLYGEILNNALVLSPAASNVHLKNLGRVVDVVRIQKANPNLTADELKGLGYNIDGENPVVPVLTREPDVVPEVVKKPVSEPVDTEDDKFEPKPEVDISVEPKPQPESDVEPEVVNKPVIEPVETEDNTSESTSEVDTPVIPELDMVDSELENKPVIKPVDTEDITLKPKPETIKPTLKPEVDNVETELVNKPVIEPVDTEDIASTPNPEDDIVEPELVNNPVNERIDTEDIAPTPKPEVDITKPVNTPVIEPVESEDNGSKPEPVDEPVVEPVISPVEKPVIKPTKKPYIPTSTKSEVEPAEDNFEGFFGLTAAPETENSESNVDNVEPVEGNFGKFFDMTTAAPKTLPSVIEPEIEPVDYVMPDLEDEDYVMPGTEGPIFERPTYSDEDDTPFERPDDYELNGAITFKPEIPVYWGEWSDFGECNVSCGVGMTIRTRKCINGQDGDITCPMGASYQETECIMENCDYDSEPIPCTWGTWEMWSNCNCDISKRTRTIHSFPEGQCEETREEEASCEDECHGMNVSNSEKSLIETAVFNTRGSDFEGSGDFDKSVGSEFSGDSSDDEDMMTKTLRSMYDDDEELRRHTRERILDEQFFDEENEFNELYLSN